MRALERDQQAAIRVAEREVSRALVALGAHVAETAGRVGGLLVEATDPTEPEEDRVNRILAAAELTAWAGRRLRPVFDRLWLKVAAKTALTLTKAGIPSTVRDALAREALETGGRRLGLIDIPAGTRAALLRVVAISKEKGLGPRATAKLIRTEVPAGVFRNAGVKYRAELIARTETLHAQRWSTLRHYRDSDHVAGVVAHDGDSDPHCAERDGQEYTIDDAEHEMNGRTVHPNCVLAWAPVLT